MSEGDPNSSRLFPADVRTILWRSAILLCTVRDTPSIARSLLEIIEPRLSDERPYDVTEAHSRIEGAAERLINEGPYSYEAWEDLTAEVLLAVGVPDAVRLVRSTGAGPEEDTATLEGLPRGMAEIRALSDRYGVELAAGRHKAAEETGVQIAERLWRRIDRGRPL